MLSMQQYAKFLQDFITVPVCAYWLLLFTEFDRCKLMFGYCTAIGCVFLTMAMTGVVLLGWSSFEVHG